MYLKSILSAFKILLFRFRGISIRIEDDLVMRNGTAYNLSDCIPKTVEEIEKCMK